MLVSGSAGPLGGDNPHGRALVGCAHPGAPLLQVLAPKILIIDIKNPRKVSFHSDNFYFCKKQHHGSSDENNICPGLVSFKSWKLEYKTRGKA